LNDVHKQLIRIGNTYTLLSSTYNTYVLDKYQEEKEPKQKLTLAIDREIIERARKAGINISAITEKVLDSITMDVKGATIEDVTAGYEKFFDVIKQVLKKYSTFVVVGVYQHEEDGEYVGLEIRLTPTGLWSDEFRLDLEDVVGFGLQPPFQILQNLLKALITAAEKNMEQLKELNIALRFVKALANDTPEGPT
jgi:hypothetical protein